MRVIQEKKYLALLDYNYSRERSKGQVHFKAGEIGEDTPFPRFRPPFFSLSPWRAAIDDRLPPRQLLARGNWISDMEAKLLRITSSPVQKLSIRFYPFDRIGDRSFWNERTCRSFAELYRSTSIVRFDLAMVVQGNINSTDHFDVSAWCLHAIMRMTNDRLDPR